MSERPQAPGYLANLMARLFHEVSGEGLHPLGIDAEQFPLLIELWFGNGTSRAGLEASQESDSQRIDRLLAAMQTEGLLESIPSDPGQNLVLTDKAHEVRDAAIASARRANQAATAALTDAELAQLTSLMNRVIDALKAERTKQP